MINFTIKDEVGNIIYNRIDDENQLTDEEIEQIYDALSNLETNMVEFSLSKQKTNDNSYTSYQSSRRCGKSEMLKQCKELCEEYNRQVAALPVQHPTEDEATGMRGPVDSEEPVDPEEPVDSVEPEKPEKPADRGFVSAPTLKEMLSSDDEIKALNKVIGNYLKRTGFSTFKGYCDDYNQQKLVETLGTIPGTYVGCGKHDVCRRSNEREGKYEKGNKEECTEACSIEDFVDYLNTYDSWAALLQDLQFYSESPTREGIAKLIGKYKRWRREQ